MKKQNIKNGNNKPPRLRKTHKTLEKYRVRLPRIWRAETQNVDQTQLEGTISPPCGISRTKD